MIDFRFWLFGCVCLFQLNASAVEDEGVLALDDDTFDTTLKDNDRLLVLFYAPWCGHSKQFAPEYENVTQKLKMDHPPILCAKVDAVSETWLRYRYVRNLYPLIKLFVQGKSKDYTGVLSEESVVTWVRKQIHPPVVPLEDVAANRRFLDVNRFAVLAILRPGDTTDVLSEAARQVDDIMFGYTTHPEIARGYRLQLHVVPPALLFFFPSDEGLAIFQGDMENVNEIVSFIKINKVPPVSRFDGEVAPEMLADGRPILFLFHHGDQKGEQLEKELRSAAFRLGKEFLVAIAGSVEPMDQRMMDDLDVELDDIPAVRILTSDWTKYKLTGELSVDSIIHFAEDFAGGALLPHFKSELAPVSQAGSVIALVGSTFNAVVRSPKDVLVNLYAPWCEENKLLESRFEAFAKRFAEVDSLVFAKADFVANDLAGVSLISSRMFRLWPAGAKDDPLDFPFLIDDSLDKFEQNLIRWLGRAVHISFDWDSYIDHS